MEKNKFLAALLAVVLVIYCINLPRFETCVTVHAAEHGREYLTGINLDLYDLLKEEVYDLASGAKRETEITISKSYEFSELGVSTYSQLVSYVRSEVDPDAIYEYLLYDCAYELYWMDKTKNNHMDLDMEVDSESVVFYLYIDFPIASTYEADTRGELDADMIALANEAAANALEIVEKYSDASDYEKLVGYKDSICELVTYEYDAYDADYGDYWQITYVFDGDEDTNVVCEGYSKAFMYLCDLTEFDSDVECYIGTGHLAGDGWSEAHMWNLIRVNGETYMVDLTNSDDLEEGDDLLFMLCADDADESSAAGYTFTVNGQTLTYTYDSPVLALYPGEVLTLGSGDIEEVLSGVNNIGDINQDGEISYLDAMMVLRYDAELIALDEEQLLLGDVNLDGEVDSLDAILILKYEAGLIDSF